MCCDDTVNFMVNGEDKRRNSTDHVTSQSLYHLTGQAPLRERQLKFTRHCIRMPTNEAANRFVIYVSKIRLSLRPCAPRTTYLHQISSHILPGEKTLEANKEITKMAVKDKKFLSCLRIKSLRTDLLSLNDDDENFHSMYCQV